MEHASTLPTSGAEPATRLIRPAPNAPLMWTLGFINRRLLVRGYFRVARIDLPRADRDRLRFAVNRSTAAFLAPNHPEFGFDWMMDKELSTYASPRMASWAAREIIDTAPWFWRRNNLVANDGGDDATAYSVEWAKKGHGVLLHPEGMVNWTANTVHPLFDGVAEMALETARQLARDDETRPTYIVPIVWKLRYVHDVSPALHREMRHIERALGLHRGDALSVASRFSALQRNLLARQMTHFAFDARSVADLDFFNQQLAFRAWLVANLQARHRVQLGTSMERTIHRLRRAVVTRCSGHPDDADAQADLERVKEASRLGGFCRDAYDTPLLSQEQIGESLKRARATLMCRGLRNVAHNLLPMPFGARVAHVRVAEPIRVGALDHSVDRPAHRTQIAELVAETRSRMQNALDAINAEIDGRVRQLSFANPFAADAGARAV